MKKELLVFKGECKERETGGIHQGIKIKKIKKKRASEAWDFRSPKKNSKKKKQTNKQTKKTKKTKKTTTKKTIQTKTSRFFLSCRNRCCKGPFEVNLNRIPPDL